jgi:hypothetical protein
MAVEEKKAAKPDTAETPSALALAEVGKPKANASDAELVAHAERYAAAKAKARWG